MAATLQKIRRQVEQLAEHPLSVIISQQKAARAAKAEGEIIAPGKIFLQARVELVVTTAAVVVAAPLLTMVNTTVLAAVEAAAG